MYQTPHHFPQFRTVLHLQVQKVTIQISPAMITGSDVPELILLFFHLLLFIHILPFLIIPTNPLYDI